MTPSTRRSAATALRVVVALAGVLAMVVGGWWWATGTSADSPAAPPPSDAAVTGTTDRTDQPVPRPVTDDVVMEPLPAGAPRRVVIPALGVTAPVVPIHTREATLVPPSDPMQLGWWAAGAMPGAPTGSALVTGHTMHAGEAALNHLEDLAPGDRVRVDTDKGSVRYEVESTEVFTKGALARHAERIFDQESPGRLVLVTCEDWDGTQYLSNVVVTATPA